MNVIIVDDESRSISFLVKLIKEIDKTIEVVATAMNINDAVSKINKFQPDFILLDIKMPGESGFDLFDKLEEINFYTIFTTAHDEYAISAIKCGALDYLLKPINIEELKQAISRVSIEKSKIEENAELKQFLSSLNPYKRKRPKKNPYPTFGRY